MPACAGVIVVLGVACSNSGATDVPTAAETVVDSATDDVRPVSTLPLAEEALDDPEVTTVATDLAPSQRVGSTTPEPETPGPCTAGDLELWTAQVILATSTADSVIRMRNTGDVWCEPDIGRSPWLDPQIEPDVWLLPGATADLVAGQMATECAEPTVIREMQIGIDRTSVVVPGSLVTCGWWLTVFYPNDIVAEECASADLQAVAVEGAVAVRNDGSMPCTIAGLTDAAGAPMVDRSADRLDVDELFPGDVVAFGQPSGTPCATPPGQVVLTDESAGDIVVDDVPCDLVFEDGPGRPWFGAVDGPLVDAPTRVDDLDAVFDALDPFAATE